MMIFAIGIVLMFAVIIGAYVLYGYLTRGRLSYYDAEAMAERARRHLPYM